MDWIMRNLFSTRTRQLFKWIRGLTRTMGGKPLIEIFHTDHVFAFSSGGSATITNRQHLCEPYHQKRVQK